jgi:hypothetical protein
MHEESMISHEIGLPGKPWGVCKKIFQKSSNEISKTTSSVQELQFQILKGKCYK